MMLLIATYAVCNVLYKNARYIHEEIPPSVMSESQAEGVLAGSRVAR